VILKANTCTHQVNSSIGGSLAQVLDLTQDVDPLSRMAKVVLMNTFMSNPASIEVLVRNFGAQWPTTHLRPFVFTASEDDDFEVRLQLCQLLRTALNGCGLAVLNGVTLVNSLARSDPNRAVRESAWSLVQDLLVADFETLSLVSKSLEEMQALESLKLEDTSKMMNDNSINEFYDEDDDMYPLRADLHNEIDCPL